MSNQTEQRQASEGMRNLVDDVFQVFRRVSATDGEMIAALCALLTAITTLEGRLEAAEGALRRVEHKAIIYTDKWYVERGHKEWFCGWCMTEADTRDTIPHAPDCPFAPLNATPENVPSAALEQVEPYRCPHCDDYYSGANCIGTGVNATEFGQVVYRVYVCPECKRSFTVENAGKGDEG